MRPFRSIMIGTTLCLLFLMGCGSRDKSSVPARQIPEKTKSAEPEKQEVNSLLKEIRAGNPFRPDHATGPCLITSDKDNVLKGIVWDAQKPFAIVGDKVIMEGDDIDHKRVIRIERDCVVLEAEGEQETLRLEELP